MTKVVTNEVPEEGAVAGTTEGAVEEGITGGVAEAVEQAGGGHGPLAQFEIKDIFSGGDEALGATNLSLALPKIRHR